MLSDRVHKHLRRHQAFRSTFSIEELEDLLDELQLPKDHYLEFFREHEGFRYFWGGTTVTWTLAQKNLQQLKSALQRPFLHVCDFAHALPFGRSMHHTGGVYDTHPIQFVASNVSIILEHDALEIGLHQASRPEQRLYVAEWSGSHTSLIPLMEILQPLIDHFELTAIPEASDHIYQWWGSKEMHISITPFYSFYIERKACFYFTSRNAFRYATKHLRKQGFFMGQIRGNSPKTKEITLSDLHRDINTSIGPSMFTTFLHSHLKPKNTLD